MTCSYCKKKIDNDDYKILIKEKETVTEYSCCKQCAQKKKPIKPKGRDIGTAVSCGIGTAVYKDQSGEHER